MDKDISETQTEKANPERTDINIAIMSLTNDAPIKAAEECKAASRVLATLPTTARNAALTKIHEALSQHKSEILAANARDLESATKAAEDGQLSLSIVSRLDLGKKGKWEDMLKGILDVRDLEDPGKLARIHSYTATDP